MCMKKDSRKNVSLLLNGEGNLVIQLEKDEVLNVFSSNFNCKTNL